MSGRKASTFQRAYNRYVSFWARLVVRRWRPLVIGITGSVGKTTTKELLGAVLTHPGARTSVGVTWTSAGNMNNDRSLPLALLGYRVSATTRRRMLVRVLTVPFRALRLLTLGGYPRTLVLEFAAGPTSTISRTAALAPPHIAIVTAIGPAHLDHFKSVVAIVEAKGALVRATAPDGLVVLGADSPPVRDMARMTRARVVMVPGRGRPLSENIARVVARHLGVADDVIESALAARGSVASRGELLSFGQIAVINDAFNANPLSMAHGIETLHARAMPGQRRVAVLGDMLELGEESARYHREMGALARSHADLLIGVGALARDYEPDHWFASSDDCAAAVASLARPGDLVLVKGSRSVRMDRVTEALRTFAGTSEHTTRR